MEKLITEDCYLIEKIVKGFIKLKRKVKIQMYEVTYSMNGIIKKIQVKADDAVTAQTIFTNMFGGGAIEIIDVVRK